MTELETILRAYASIPKGFAPFMRRLEENAK